MRCMVCLQDSTENFDFFDQENLYAVTIITKHLWFLPKVDTNYMSKSVCFNCWNTLKTFNKFFTEIEEAHNNLNIKCDPTNLYDQSSEIKDVKLEENGDIFNVQNIFSDIPAVRENDDTIQDIDNNMTDGDDDYDPNKAIIKSKNKSTKNRQIKDTKKSQIKKTTTRKLRKTSETSADVDTKINKFMVLTCRMCLETFQTFAKLRSHFRNEHNRSGYAFCCGKKIFKRCRLVDHIDTHVNPHIFKCPDCDKVFNSREYLQLHIKNLHEEEKITHQCDQCPKKFSWKAMLDAHKHIHTPKENWNIKCDECDKTFATKYFLANHKHSVHYSKSNLKICHICGKNVSNKMFKRHQKTHSDIDEPRVQCEICGTWLKNQRYLKIHLENHEESAVDHICTICGKNSPNRRALAKHVRDTHTENRTHKCNICDKSFKRRLLLTQHITTHTGEFLYNCPYCSKSFTYDSTFHVHKKKEHPVEFEEERLKRRGGAKLKINHFKEFPVVAQKPPSSISFKTEKDNKYTDIFNVGCENSNGESQYFHN